jgi:hypothetical protein
MELFPKDVQNIIFRMIHQYKYNIVMYELNNNFQYLIDKENIKTLDDSRVAPRVLEDTQKLPYNRYRGWKLRLMSYTDDNQTFEFVLYAPPHYFFFGN